jgi:four helix bundle protein
MKENAIRSFKDLRTWQEAHKLVLLVYKTSKDFPTSEQYILSSQIQRAGISITSNIAEGFSRNTIRDKINFYHIALGSLAEMQNQLELAKDLNYLSLSKHNEIEYQHIIVSKMLNGLIKGTQKLPSHNHNRPQVSS